MAQYYVEEGYSLSDYFQTDVYIDWPSKTIVVPKFVSSLIALTPLEIRQLDLNQFRLKLKDLEDSDEGIIYPRTHNHNTEVVLGGVSYARIIEIINDYTITFEDGRYAINLVGANSNVGDKINVNQVSVRSTNSAGLVNLSSLLSSAYQGRVVVDILRGQVGTANPIGLLSTPSNNLIDAKAIAQSNGIDTFYIIGNITLTSEDNLDEYTLRGQNLIKSTITVEDGASVNRCEFSECHLIGVLDGGSTVRECLITNLNYLSGYLYQCILSPGTITLGGNSTAYLFDCYSGLTNVDKPVIDCGGAGQSLVIRGYSGDLKIANKTGVEPITINLHQGTVVLDDTVTNGLVMVYGDGCLYDNLGNHILSGNWNGVTIVNDTTSVLHSHTLDSISDAVWDHASAAQIINDLTFVKGIEGGRWRIDTSLNQMVFYSDDNTTELARFDLKDSTGSATSSNVFERVRT